MPSLIDKLAVHGNVLDELSGVDERARSVAVQYLTYGAADKRYMRRAEPGGLIPVLNVQTLFGAVGDGVADATAAIQAALDAVPDEGGVVYFPRATGAYMVDPDTSLLPKSNTILHIEKGAVLRAKAVASSVNAVLHIDDVDNVHVMGGGAIRGDAANHDVATNANNSDTLTTALSGGETSIQINDTTGWGSTSNNLTIVGDDGSYHHSTFTIASGTQLNIASAVPAGFAAAIGNAVYDAAGEGGMCIRIENSTNVTVRDIECYEAWGDGVYITEYERSTDTGSKWIQLINLNCHNNRRQGLSVVGGRYVHVLGGMYHSQQGAQPNSGIDLEPSSTYEVDDVTVEGVFAFGNARDGIRVLGPNTARCRILNNVCNGNGLRGVAVYYDDGHEVRGNQCHDNASQGIYISNTNADADENRVIDNVVTDNGGNGIEVVDQGANELARGTIRGNEIRGNSGNGIQNTGGRNWIISDNKIRDNGDYGINMDGALECVVSGNVVREAGLIGIRLTNGSNANKVDGNQLLENNRFGMAVGGSDRNLITGNLFRSNGRDANNSYDQLNLASNSNDNTITNNVFLAAGSGNEPRYDLNIQTSDCDDNKVGANDWSNGGGQTLNFRDNGTGTDSATVGNYT